MRSADIKILKKPVPVIRTQQFRSIESCSIPDREAGAHWFAICTRPRLEKAVAGVLGHLGVSYYLPLKCEVRQWSDRKQSIDLPLLAGYLFVQMDLLKESRIPVLRVPGVVSFVGNQTGPLAIPEVQIKCIHTVLANRIECDIVPALQEGDRVRVVRGPLKGMEGKLLRSNDNTRLMLSIDLIQKALSVSVSRQDVELLSQSAA